MQVVCDKCGGETKPKQVTSKKTGKTYTLYECQSGCMNGQYKYSCFAPKTQKEMPQNDNTQLLEEIKAICLAINAKLPAKKTKPPVDEFENEEDLDA